jgi:fructosamine-3-kinase
VRGSFLQAPLRRALDDPSLVLERTEPVGGGCIHEAACLVTSRGRFFAKWGGRGPADLFVREAEGLAALRAAASSLVVPAVIVASPASGDAPGFLILEYLDPGATGSADEERLGRGLAEIHGRFGAGFGFPSTTYCGGTPQDNTPGESWPEFYRVCRLRPLVTALEGAGRLPASDRKLYEAVMERLETLLPASSPASLIHGDLWSGNVLRSSRGPALIDPACTHADREMEFGITTLFGGLPPRAWAAYEEALPLPPGWRDRNPLYQVYHLLNHALLFGGHYAQEARERARRFAG